MSSALYSTRLWWHGHRGAAKLWGAEVVLTEAPAVIDQVVEGLDYVPEIHLWQIQPRGDRWRDMTPAEVAACDRMLRKLCVPVKDSEW